MTLYYYFDDNGEPFEFEVSHSDIMNNFVPHMKTEDVLHLAKQIYDEQIVGSPEELEYKEEYGIDNLTFFDNPDGPKVHEAALALIRDTDSDDIVQMMESQISEYFREDAYEAYEDGKRYRSDPYGYNGVNYMDF